jgi:hypothetical protein
MIPAPVSQGGDQRLRSEAALRQSLQATGGVSMWRLAGFACGEPKQVMG